MQLIRDDIRLVLIELTANYARGVDRSDPEGVAACFTADGVLRRFDMTPPEPKLLSERKGREEIIRVLHKMNYDATFHFIGQQQFRTAGNTDRAASGETYCIAHHMQTNGDDPATDFVMYIRYQDKFVNLPGEGWLIAERDLHIDWTETHPVEGT